mgnify:CR=1 FL=1
MNKLTGLDINWLNDPNTALICVAILTAWLNSGINFLYFSAGLGNIDETIYERASVDGASSVQQFFSLTLPGLSPIMFYTLVVNIIQAFQSFGQIKILTEGVLMSLPMLLFIPFTGMRFLTTASEVRQPSLLSCL